VVERDRETVVATTTNTAAARMTGMAMINIERASIGLAPRGVLLHLVVYPEAGGVVSPPKEPDR
jgi:hypothetical protein